MQPCTNPAINISIHALREEGDHFPLHRSRYQQISIHALREEGDVGVGTHIVQVQLISIHALREEGDAITSRSRGA